MLHDWIHHPQRLGFRKALLQIHLWSGVTLGLYILFISITGSVLVYRNELYVVATPDPIISVATNPALSDDALQLQAERLYPRYQSKRIRRFRNPDRAVEIWLEDGEHSKQRLFDPRTGEDVGNAVETAVMLVSKLIEIHESFLAGQTGRRINGYAGLAVLLVLFTGLVLWWPGVNRWQRSMTMRRGVGWRRMIWDLHSMAGIWNFAFMTVFALSGVYLCFPETFHQLAEYIETSNSDNAGRRVIDDVLYWLAFLHFGRINGIGIPCDGPGICDQSVKAFWAICGLAPALMFISGTLMWWNRSIRRKWK